MVHSYKLPCFQKECSSWAWMFYRGLCWLENCTAYITKLNHLWTSSLLWPLWITLSLTKYAHVWTRGTGCCTELPYKADNPDANNTSNWLVWIWGRSWLRSLIMTSAALECSQPTTNCFCSEHRLTHPWEGKSKPTQLPSGTAKPCYSHKHITHPLCQLWSQQWTATATGTLVCPWCSKLTSFFRFSLTRSPTSAVREEALLAQTPRFTRDFTPTHSLLHIRPQKKKKLEARGQFRFQQRQSLVHLQQNYNSLKAMSIGNVLGNDSWLNPISNSG